MSVACSPASGAQAVVAGAARTLVPLAAAEEEVTRKDMSPSLLEPL